MAQQARINSIPALRQLRAALGTFAKAASLALEEAGTDVHRTLHWLGEDRHRYWKTQVHRANDQYVQAKLTLKRKQIMDRALAGSPGSCIDEKKALQKAEARLREAEHKLKRVRRWTQQIEKELSDYRGGVQGLVNALDVDIPNARARLDKMVDSLAAYVTLAPPQAARIVEETAEADVFRLVTGEEVEPSSDFPEMARALRDLTPEWEARQEAPAASEADLWPADVEFSDALLAAIRNLSIEPSEAPPGENVVFARLDRRPNLLYLERVESDHGDSGWYLGADRETEASGLAAAPVSDLLEACPALADILNLPPGHLVVTVAEPRWQAVFDAKNELLWQSTDSGNAASAEGMEND
jgi:soluble cytochrome b562